MAIAKRHYPILLAGDKDELDAVEVDNAVRNTLMAVFALQEDVTLMQEKVGGAIRRGEIGEDDSATSRSTVATATRTIVLTTPTPTTGATLVSPISGRLPFLNGALELDGGINAPEYNSSTKALTIRGALNITGAITGLSTLSIAAATTLSGTLAVTGVTTLQGALIVDLTDAEAILVRKDGDTGDLFRVDTLSAHTVTVTSQTDGHGVLINGAVNNVGIHLETTGANGERWRILSTAGSSGFGQGNLAIDRADNLPRMIFEGALTRFEQSPVVIDIDHAEAFMVRKDGDAGDVLTVDTSTDLLTLAGNALLAAADLGNDVPGRLLTIERNTNVAVGTDGPAAGVLEMERADGTSSFFWVDDHDHLRLHTAAPTGSLATATVDGNTAGFVLAEHFGLQYHFVSPGGGSGIFYAAGFYDAPIADANLTDAGPTVTHGIANHPYYAHAFIVAAAAGTASGGAGTVEIEVSGTSIDDNGTRTTTDIEVLTTDITALSTDEYLETVKKWIGTVTYTLQVSGGGTHTTFAADFNYGFAKHDDATNHDFQIQSFELTGRAGQDDTSFNVELLHHQFTGWTYHASAFVPGTTPIVDVASILSTESDLTNGEHFAFKKTDLSTQVAGEDDEEGFLVRITTGANNAVESLNFTVGVALN
jgi:hypothetical protein